MISAVNGLICLFYFSLDLAAENVAAGKFLYNIAMTDMLLQTKWSRPQLHADLISRAHLWRLLDDIAHRNLALLSAPAGFGKSTLLASWLNHIQQAQRLVGSSHPPYIAWLSLDESDNDPALFMRYLLAAVQHAHPELGQSAAAHLHSAPRPTLRAVIAHFINDFSEMTHPLLFVLDDYHVIHNQVIHQEISYWLAHMTGKCHLIIASRADPPLPLAQMRVRREIIEIRAQELKLDTEEADRLLNEIMDLELTPDAVRLLAQRTEGWAAGLQLAGLALKGQSPIQKSTIVENFGGSHVFVIDYFMEEVWSRVPADWRSFLLDTAVLNRLSASLCDAVTAGQKSQSVLESLHRHNLFVIPLDSRRQWFRYHHLFAGILRARLQQEKDSAYVQELHHRAGLWYEEQRMTDTAISHLLQAGALDHAAALIESQVVPTQKQGRLNTLLGWIDALPPAIVRQRPGLQIAQGQALFLAGQTDKAQTVLNEARRLLQRLPRTAATDHLRGQLATQLAILAAQHEDTSRIIQEAQEALGYLADEYLAYRARAGHMLGVGYGLQGDTERLLAACYRYSRLAARAGHPFLQAHILQLLGSTQAHTGQLPAAAHTYQQVADMTSAPGTPAPYAGLGLIGLAEVQLEWHDLAQSARSLAQGIYLCEQGGIGYNLPIAQATAVRLALAQNDSQKAEMALAALENMMQASPALLMTAVQYAICAARYWLWQGETDRARQLLAEPLAGAGSIQVDRLPIVVREVYLVALAWAYLHGGKHEQLQRCYDSVLASAKPGGRQARILEISLLYAHDRQLNGQNEAAARALEIALEIASPAGYHLTILEHGRPVQDLLSSFARSSRGSPALRAFATQIARSFMANDPLPPPAAGSSSDLVEPLSTRELEVLRLLSSGQSNKQIAAELSISINTVKKHTSNIYAKLVVNGRTQAIARAHDLHLV